MTETLALLKYYYDTQNDVLIFASSGTGAMEGSVSNLLSPGERMLVGTAGKFGERWFGLAQAYGVEAVKVESPYGQPVNIDAMKQKTRERRAVPRRLHPGHGNFDRGDE